MVKKIELYKSHCKKWDNCKKCSLHETRKKVVHARGILPCDILFIGEAPGESENLLGKPFVGPAGKLLDKIIEEVKELSEGKKFTTAYTNIVGCIPIEDGKKIHEPTKQSIQSCKNKLQELINIFSPKKIVAVGKTAAKNIPPSLVSLNIVHPSALLRNKGIVLETNVRKIVSDLLDLVESLN